jgi:co-chaperonin GroES (HSP10)
VASARAAAPPKRTYGESGDRDPHDAQTAEEIVTTVGKVIDMGEFAYKSKTNAGLLLADDPSKPGVGTFVLFAQYAGQEVVLNDEQKTKLRIIDDTEVLAIVSDPEQIKRYVA